MSMKKVIAICEDDYDLGEALQNFLNAEGYKAILTSCAEELDLACSAISPDALLLDLQLPGQNGNKIATRYHKKSPRLPIIMMSIDNSSNNQLNCFSNGAMLYLSKPFQPEALKAALDGIFRIERSVKNGEIALYPNSLVLKSNDRAVKLSSREVAILSLLTLRMPEPVETFEILEAISRDKDEIAGKSTIEVLISRLRKKLRENNIDQSELNIRAHHGQGYSIHGNITIHN